MDAPIKQIRVVIQQPVLPSYRIGVFRALAQRSGLDVRVVYSEAADQTNCEPQGFAARHVAIQRHRVLGRTLEWSPAQLEYAEPERADVLVLSWNLNVTSLIPALIKAKRNGVRTLLWGHGYSKHDRWWRALPRRETTRLADAVLLYNHTVANRLIEQGVPAEKVFVALNALDEEPIFASRDRWAEHPDRLAAFQHENGLTGKPVVLFVSRLNTKCRLEQLIHAAAKLRQVLPEIRIVAIGDGDATPYKRLAAQLDVSENIQFHPGLYDEERLAPWFLSAHAFCYPGQIGLAALHAFAFGLPVVTGDDLENHGPEISSLVPEGNGLLFRDGNVDHMAEQLLRILGDDELYQRMSINARRTIEQKFNLRNMIDGFESAIRYAAATPRRGPSEWTEALPT
jgi:glycosyltransferase involved in cell wall biosynthesis